MPAAITLSSGSSGRWSVGSHLVPDPGSDGRVCRGPAELPGAGCSYTAVRSESEPGESRAPFLRCLGETPRLDGPRTEAVGDRGAMLATPIGTLTNITDRQPKAPVSRAPMISPTAAPHAVASTNRAIARARCGPGLVMAVGNTSTLGAASAAPPPWKARAAINVPGEDARPPAPPAPVSRARRAPTNTPILPLRRMRSAGRPDKNHPVPPAQGQARNPGPGSGRPNRRGRRRHSRRA